MSRNNFIVPLMCIIAMLLILLTSCEKDEIIDEITNSSDKITNSIDTLKIMDYKEDTIVNEVGCYYPIYKN